MHFLRFQLRTIFTPLSGAISGRGTGNRTGEIRTKVFFSLFSLNLNHEMYSHPAIFIFIDILKSLSNNICETQES